MFPSHSTVFLRYRCFYAGLDWRFNVFGWCVSRPTWKRMFFGTKQGSMLVKGCSFCVLKIEDQKTALIATRVDWHKVSHYFLQNKKMMLHARVGSTSVILQNGSILIPDVLQGNYHCLQSMLLNWVFSHRYYVSFKGFTFRTHTRWIEPSKIAQRASTCHSKQWGSRHLGFLDAIPEPHVIEPFAG